MLGEVPLISLCCRYCHHLRVKHEQRQLKRLTIFGGSHSSGWHFRCKHYVMPMLQECKDLIFLIFSCFISFVSNNVYTYLSLWENMCFKLYTNIYFDLSMQTIIIIVWLFIHVSTFLFGSLRCSKCLTNFCVL